jgi:hypothetical protein
MFPETAQDGVNVL